MDILGGLEECKGNNTTDPNFQTNKTIAVQLVISLAIGLSSFISFCILRPRWTSLYAARKRQTDAASTLPDLPDTFFGWIPVLYDIDEQQVLAAAGLDAYVFLSFFKMSIKFLTITFLLVAAIMVPINAHFVGLPGLWDDQPVKNTSLWLTDDLYLIDSKGDKQEPTSYLWSYLVFTYVFTGLALFFIIDETKKIIRVRQDYLGSQSTITDRTIKLSGIPPELRSEEEISAILEKLEIGKVESVTLCRNWKEIDRLMEERAHTLRSLEGAWTSYISNKDVQKSVTRSHVPDDTFPNHEEADDDDAGGQEHDHLMGEISNRDTTHETHRPTTRIWYGFLQLQSRKVDAIDYYEEKLRKVDEKIKAARKKSYKPTPLAFVTMDSIPACQMAVQALIDPRPTQFLASLAPAPSDIVWSNTYLPRSNRMIRSWSISIFVTLLSIVWVVALAPFASLLNLCSVKKVWPELGDFLGSHEISKALIQTGLPTLVVSILNIAVPFLYDYLSNMQGMISQSEVELSVISKNFFFTFFNVFFVFTAFSTATSLWSQIQDSLTDTTKVAYTLAQSVKRLGLFYTNFILLQGIGLFPLRLLEFGSVSLYPAYKMSAKTPRDFAELAQPPVFKYGFYLPTSILILIICIVYSILPAGYQVIFFGIIYFVLGYFTYKYQLLYAMDHPQHATGRAWTMICYRLMVGLGVFQVAMAGVMALGKAFTPAGLVVPLIGFTIWFSYFYGRTYEPLTKYIALRSIRREDDPDVNIADESIGISRPPGHIRRLSTVDEEREKGQTFINPSLVVPLDKVWINRGTTDDEDDTPPEIVREESGASSMSLGDAHVWRENGDNNEEGVTSSYILLSGGVAASNAEPAVVREHPATPLTPATTILKLHAHQLTAVGVPKLTDSTKDLTNNLIAQQPLQHSEFNELEEASSYEETQIIAATIPLLRQSGLWTMENSVDYTAQCAEAPDLLTIEAPDFLSSKGPGSLQWPSRMNSNANLVMRGRPLRRTNRPGNPLERAESRKRMRDATVQVDLQSIKRRCRESIAFSKDLADPFSAFEYDVFEPCPHDPICTKVSEIMMGPERTLRGEMDTSNLVAGVMRTNSYESHAIRRPSICSSTSLFADSNVLVSAPTLTAEANLVLVPKLNHAHSSDIKSSCEILCSTSSERRLSAMNLLPAEILSHIYSSLSPADFNAARHTCRLWFIYSLDHTILEAMLRRAGWSAYIPEEIEYKDTLHERIKVNNEWLMSKRLSRECALGPEWTGNGLYLASESLKQSSTAHDLKSTPFVHMSTIDFTELGVHYPGADEINSGILFTVSACCRFLMVAHGCLIYIFELNGSEDSHDDSATTQSSTLRPVTCVICPQRVLACSMDTSSHRYAIAVLLDGRMGLVCELTNMKRRTRRMSVSRPKMNQDLSSSRIKEYRNRVSISSSQSRGTHRSQTEQPFVFPVIAAEPSQTRFPLDLPQSLWEDMQIVPDAISAADESQSKGRILFGQPGFQCRAANHFLPSSMPVESSIPTIYAPLCSADDPPRSVALCPQRRCVAFGCSSGIELHWVDALTGQDLSRWFPLTAPSDYLYFLPPRPGVDSAKKLRLISSAGQPDERSVIAQKFGSSRNGNHGSPFWGAKASLYGKSSSDLASVRRAGLHTSSRDNSDHYRAVPLSDGYHILFTDPSTGLLCMGSDAPIGGPTKLLRKIWFAGPQGQVSPVAYTGGSNLRWGVRVVAAYGIGTEQSIWLFSVPPDVFTESLAEQGNINLPYMRATHETENTNRDWMPWWSRPSSESSPKPAYGASHNLIIRHDGIWPIPVRGQEIGRCNGVVDLAIDAGPDMKIWAFGKDGLAKTWMIDDGNLDRIPERKILVMRDGTIRTSDTSGDIQMFDSLSSSDESSQPGTENQDHETYDGSTSLQNSAIHLQPQKTWKCQIGEAYRLKDLVSLDRDGDVLMADLPLPSPESPIYESWPAAMGQYGRDEVRLIHRANHCFACPAPTAASIPAYLEGEELDRRDMIDVLTGIARIEIEIR